MNRAVDTASFRGVRSWTQLKGSRPVRRAALGGRTVLAVALAMGGAPPVAVHAQSERFAPLVLQLPVTARTMAMGGLTVATRDVEAAFGNPALVGGNSALSLSLGRYASGASTAHAATSMSVGMFGVGFGVQLLDAPQVQAADALRSDVLTDDGRIAASNLTANVSASLTWKGIRWGVAARYAESRAAGARGGSASLDLGMAKDFINGMLSTGIAVQHLGRDIPGDGTGRDLPTRVAIGAVGGYPRGKWIDLGASANVALREDVELFPTAGGEISVVPIEGIAFAVRGGARRPELRAQRALTGGVGVQYDRLSLDYGWEDMRGKGGAHRITMRIR